MINTIFYFVNDFDTYQQKVQQHDISAKTIVFVEDQQAIYKDGKRYGNMGYDDIKQKVIEIVTNDEDGKRAAGDAYDDSGLIDALDRIDAITRAEQERLSNLIQQLDTEIQEKVNSMFDDAQWIRENVAQNEYLHQDMTWIGDEINAYLQQVGYWTTDSHGNTITQWSKIQQSVDSISTNVNALSQNVDGRFTAVQSAINQSVDQKIQTAKTEISNMYASGQDVNGIKQVVEWMYSGLKSSAGPDQSVAEIISAGKNSLVGAISDMRTQVNKLKNGDYVATANLTTQIESYITGQLSTAGLITETTLAQAFSTVFSRLDNGQVSGISGLETRVQALENGGFIADGNLVTAITNHKADIIAGAGLATQAEYNALGDTYLAKANLVAEITNKAGQISTSAGLQLKSDLDDAVAALVSQTSSTKAAIEVIATGNSSSITVNADDINMTASHKLSLNSDFLNIASNFYSTIANNITLTADKITIDGQHQLDLTSQNLSIAGDQITMSSSHPLALNTTGVTVNGQPFFNAISNELNVDSVVTNKLESGTGTFKGNVEATSFTAGSQGQTGIVVMSGSFNPAGADTAKMYFAYDPSQNAPNLYIYDSTPDTNNNNNPIGWRCLSFSNALTTNEYFTSPGWYVYTGNLDGYIKDTDTTLSTTDFTPVTLYIGHDDNRYYTSNVALNTSYANGYYYKDTFDDTVPTPKDSSNNTLSWYDTSQDIIYNPNPDKSGGWIPMLQILEEDGSTGKYIAAEIHSLNSVAMGGVTTNDTYTGYYAPLMQAPVYMENGITKTAPGSGIASQLWYSNDAILSYTKDLDGHITNIVRGFSFVKPATNNTFDLAGGSNAWWATGDDLISIIVDKQNRGWRTSHLVQTNTNGSGSYSTTYDYPSCVVKASNAGDKNASYSDIQDVLPNTGVTGTNASVYSLW